MRHSTLLILVAGTLLRGTTALAQATELDLFEKKVLKYAIPNSDVFTGKTKGLCACISDSSPLTGGAAGVITTFRFSQRVVVQCWVLSASIDGTIDGVEPCDNWVPLAK